MNVESDVAKLIRKGGVVTNVSGSTLSEIYESVLKQSDLSGYDKNSLLTELLEREKVLSTAVGNTVAIPHPRRPLMKNEEDQRIFVVYLNEPIDMKAPDSLKVSTLFMLFTSNSQTHLKVLSSLAKALHSLEFKRELEKKPSVEILCDFINRL